jgi:hypothetical protein
VSLGCSRCGEVRWLTFIYNPLWTQEARTSLSGHNNVGHKGRDALEGREVYLAEGLDWESSNNIEPGGEADRTPFGRAERCGGYRSWLFGGDFKARITWANYAIGAFAFGSPFGPVWSIYLLPSGISEASQTHRKAFTRVYIFSCSLSSPPELCSFLFLLFLIVPPPFISSRPSNVHQHTTHDPLALTRLYTLIASLSDS